jgi:hypothetical protein
MLGLSGKCSLVQGAWSGDAMGKTSDAMRFCVVLLLVVGTFALPVSRLAKGAANIFSLAISTPRETVKTGSNIELLVKLTNDTNHEITLSSRNTYCDYKLEVGDSNGHSAPETEQKRTLNCSAYADAGRHVIIQLKPGEHHEDLIFMNQLFDMNRPNKYTVRLTRDIPKQLGQGQVSSNTIAITVTE